MVQLHVFGPFLDPHQATTVATIAIAIATLMISIKMESYNEGLRRSLKEVYILVLAFAFSLYVFC